METRLRQPIVVVLGHVDSGKCVSGDTLIHLADGRILPAESVFSYFKTGNAVRLADGEVFRAKGLHLLTVCEDNTVRPACVSHVWKLRAECLVTVRTEIGWEVSCTPEHMFLVERNEGRPVFVRTENLRPGDRLLIPTGVRIRQNNLSRLKSEILSRLSDDFQLLVSQNVWGEISSIPAFNGVRYRKSVSGPHHQSLRGIRPSQLRSMARTAGLSFGHLYDAIEGLGLSPRKAARTEDFVWLGAPRSRHAFKAFMHLAGLLHFDGSKESALPSTISEEPLTVVSSLAHRAFCQEKSTCARLRTCLLSEERLNAFSKLFVEIFGPPTLTGPPSPHPDFISILPDDMLISFLRGFFRSRSNFKEDGSVHIICKSPEMRRRLPLYLQRLGILTLLSESPVHLLVKGESNVARFLSYFGQLGQENLRTAELRHFVKPRQEESSENGTIQALQEGSKMSLLGILRPQHEKPSCPPGRLMLLTTKAASEPDAASLPPDNLFTKVRVKELQLERGERTVYDFTVPGTHNFLANGLVVHNTSVLDRIRGTGVQAREAGGITQQIGASFFPAGTLAEICGPLVKIFGGEVKIPGLLVIDTPGHEAFANLRTRGGSAADIAILVVDITKGLEAQSYESIDILRARKVPFLVALNKVDLIPGWAPDPKRLVKDAPASLQPATVERLDEAIYRVVGQLSQVGFVSEAYFRVKDFTKEVSIVPVSARTGEGISELLAVLIGLSQQYLSKKLQVSSSKARGIVLEVKEEPGLGPTANVILIEGKLEVGSRVLLAKRGRAESVKVKALLMPKPLDEMRDPRDRFEPVQSVAAAAGVKLAAPDLDGVLAGSPLVGLENEEDEDYVKKQLMKEVSSAIFEKEQLGVVIKADTLGALEALNSLLKKQSIPVRVADIGAVTKSDVIQAGSVRSKDRYLGVILGFNVRVSDEAAQEAAQKGVKIFIENVIYTLVENYMTWARQERENEARAAFSSMTLPCKFTILKGFVFRRSNPAVFGVEILAGKLRQKTTVMNSSGEEVGVVQQIENEGQQLQEADTGARVAVSMKGVVVGRQVREGEELYSLPSSDEARLLKQKFAENLSSEELQVLEEIIQIRRKVQMLYGF
jgi:translation initiation factor 5B